MPSLPLSRLGRLFIIVFVLLLIPSAYFFYPDRSTPPSPADRADHYEAGGIDSEHYREPVVPNFEDEESRSWSDETVLKQKQGHVKPESNHAKQDYGDSGSDRMVGHGQQTESGQQANSEQQGQTHPIADLLTGEVIMPKLENATAKAELGRAAWRVLHLMTLRFPDEPTLEQREALKSYMHLFSRLYPCGECAAEFQRLLKEYPPQTSSRKVASLWLCHVHNQVNERLGKPEFDCLTLDSTYDCGCGDDPSGEAAKTTTETVKNHVGAADTWRQRSSELADEAD